MVIWFIEIKYFDAEVLNLCWWRTLCSYKLTNESILCFIKVFCVSQLLETFFFFLSAVELKPIGWRKPEWRESHWLFLKTIAQLPRTNHKVPEHWLIVNCGWGEFV